MRESLDLDTCNLVFLLILILIMVLIPKFMIVICEILNALETLFSSSASSLGLDQHILLFPMNIECPMDSELIPCL